MGASLVLAACTTSSPATTAAAPVALTTQPPAPTTTTVPLNPPRLLTSYELFGIDEVSRAEDVVALSEDTVVFVGTRASVDTAPRPTYWVTSDGEDFDVFEVPQAGTSVDADAYQGELAILTCSDDGIFGGLWVGVPGVLEERGYPTRLGCANTISYAGDNIVLDGRDDLFISTNGGEDWTRIDTSGRTAAYRSVAGPDGFVFTGWIADEARTVHFVPGQGSTTIDDVGFASLFRAGDVLTVADWRDDRLFQLRDGEWVESPNSAFGLLPDASGNLFDFEFPGTVSTVDGEVLVEPGAEPVPSAVAIAGDVIVGFGHEGWFRAVDGGWVMATEPIFSEGAGFETVWDAATVGGATIYADGSNTSWWLRRGEQFEPMTFPVDPDAFVMVGAHGDEFVAIVTNDQHSQVIRSPDGVTWTEPQDLDSELVDRLDVSGDRMLLEAYDFETDSFLTYLSDDGLATFTEVDTPDSFYETICLADGFAVGQGFVEGGTPIERWDYATGAAQALDVFNDGMSCVGGDDSVLTASWNREWLTLNRVTADDVEAVWTHPAPPNRRFQAALAAEGDVIVMLLDITEVGGDEAVQLLYSDNGGESFRSTDLDGGRLGFYPIVTIEDEQLWVAGTVSGQGAFWVVDRATAANGEPVG